MLSSSGLYSSIISYMPAGAQWPAGSPQSMFITKCAEGLVGTFQAGVTTPGTCNPQSPVPHTHSVALNGGILQTKLAECGFTGLTNTLSATMAAAVSGYLSSNTQFSIFPNGCPPHTHTLTFSCSASGLSSAMRPGFLNGQYASLYLNAIANGILTYIPTHVIVSIVSHPAGLHTLS